MLDTEELNNDTQVDSALKAAESSFKFKIYCSYFNAH